MILVLLEECVSSKLVSESNKYCFSDFLIELDFVLLADFSEQLMSFSHYIVFDLVELDIMLISFLFWNSKEVFSALHSIFYPPPKSIKLVFIQILVDLKLFIL